MPPYHQPSFIGKLPVLRQEIVSHRPTVALSRERIGFYEPRFSSSLGALCLLRLA